jgi:nucleoside-diphosphate-sugar epimerase
VDLQYVEDVAETFVRCLLAPLEGAHVFNLEGAVVHIDELIAMLETVRPGAAKLITASGPQVPVAYRMDASLLRSMIPGIPRTPLNEGILRTIERFEQLTKCGVGSGK